MRATSTGRANRFTSTRMAAQVTKPTTPAPRSARIGADDVPNGKGCPTLIRLSTRITARAMIASTTASTRNRRIGLPFRGL